MTKQQRIVSIHTSHVRPLYDIQQGVTFPYTLPKWCIPEVLGSLAEDLHEASPIFLWSCRKITSLRAVMGNDALLFHFEHANESIDGAPR